MSAANAQGVPMYVFLLWIAVALFVGAIAFTFRGSVQV